MTVVLQLVLQKDTFSIQAKKKSDEPKYPHIYQKHEEKANLHKITSTIQLDTDLHRPHHPLHHDKRASQGFECTTTQQIRGKVWRRLHRRKGQTHIPTTWFRGSTQQQ